MLYIKFIFSLHKPRDSLYFSVENWLVTQFSGNDWFSRLLQPPANSKLRMLKFLKEDKVTIDTR